MNKGKTVLVAAGLLAALLPGALAWRALWPVRIDTLCGVFQSRQGGVIQITPDHAFTVSEALFGPNADGSTDTISGSGQLGPDDLAPDGQVVLRMKDARAQLELNTQRRWRGEVSLWQWADDPGTGERETFVQKSAC
ncbi:hypothetical protein [Micromonospora musae]|uniref:hypothetical protein n=1 Tax=Micromonospora musae TaxID=1894970 RepID=UPI0011C43B44|nr:hypothetical protein [Micromonospora musae]